MTQPQHNFVVLGDTIAEVSEPTNAVRWLLRNGERVLQQRWIAKTQDRWGNITAMQEQWRDVPIVDGE